MMSLKDVSLKFQLTFEEHLNNIVAKVNKTVGLLRNFRNFYQGQR